MKSLIQNRNLLLWDALLFGLTPLVAYLLRFERFGWSVEHTVTALTYLAVALAVKLAVFISFGMYARVWRHASVPEMAAIVRAVAVASVGCVVLGAYLLPMTGLTPLRVPLSALALDLLFTGVVAVAPRLALKASESLHRRRHGRSGRRTLIAGAGSAGVLIVRELENNPDVGLTPVGFVDDSPNKLGHRLSDLPVLGTLDDIEAVIADHGIQEIVIAMPTAPGSVVRNVVRAATTTGTPVRTVPGLYEIVSGRVGISTLRNVEIQDLLRREPIETDLERVRSLVSGRVVLVTGAGGSIGSELARQLAKLTPTRLVLLGNNENDIFDVLNELRRGRHDLELIPVIADIRSLERLRGVFETYRPEIVFHAAAHKHVPLMEEHVVEAVTNNVSGTDAVVRCAVQYDVEHFVLISTDKAVRPTSVMGATKRVAEMIVQCAALEHRRHFVSVRFGNVLGSRGSVIPTFLKQIEAGGPVTITHPEMERYFMTIPEAVQLVMQAGAQGKGGELFMLDMGEPVRIVDLATDLIRLSGRDVGRDIELRYVGTRPGERLFEEMFLDEEDVARTEHPKVLRARNSHPAQDFRARLAPLQQAADDGASSEELRELLIALVPEFRPQNVRRADGGHSTGTRSTAGHGTPAVLVERRSGTDRRGSPDRRVDERRATEIPGEYADRRKKEDRRWPGDRRSGLDRRQSQNRESDVSTGTARFDRDRIGQHRAEIPSMLRPAARDARPSTHPVS